MKSSVCIFSVFVICALTRASDVMALDQLFRHLEAAGARFTHLAVLRIKNDVFVGSFDEAELKKGPLTPEWVARVTPKTEIQQRPLSVLWGELSKGRESNWGSLTRTYRSLPVPLKAMEKYEFIVSSRTAGDEGLTVFMFYTRDSLWFPLLCELSGVSQDVRIVRRCAIAGYISRSESLRMFVDIYEKRLKRTIDLTGAEIGQSSPVALTDPTGDHQKLPSLTCP